MYLSMFPVEHFACVAQLVVQLIRNEQVAGSSPVTSSRQQTACISDLYRYTGSFLIFQMFLKFRICI